MIAIIANVTAMTYAIQTKIWKCFDLVILSIPTIQHADKNRYGKATKPNAI